MAWNWKKKYCQKITTDLARIGSFLVLVAKYYSSQDRIILLKWNNLEESLSTAFDISRKKSEHDFWVHVFA